MNKRRLIPILLLATLLSGCVTIRIETKINRDGSGTKSYVLAIDKSVMSMMESMAEEAGTSVDDIWETAREGAASIKGARIEEYSDDEAEGIKVTVPFENLEQLEALTASDAFEGADVVTVNRDGDVTTLRATVNVGDLASGFAAAGDESIEGFDLGEIEINYTYAVEIEGKILEYAPKEIAEVQGAKVTWDLSQAQQDAVELMVKWEPGGGLDTLATVLIAVALAAFALILVGIIVTLRGKRRREPPPPTQVES